MPERGPSNELSHQLVRRAQGACRSLLLPHITEEQWQENLAQGSVSSVNFLTAIWIPPALASAASSPNRMLLASDCTQPILSSGAFSSNSTSASTQQRRWLLNHNGAKGRDVAPAHSAHFPLGKQRLPTLTSTGGMTWRREFGVGVTPEQVLDLTGLLVKNGGIR